MANFFCFVHFILILETMEAEAAAESDFVN